MIAIGGWLKLVLPLVSDYAKEVLFPGTEAKKTSPLERICVLIIIILVALLAYLGEGFFNIYDKNQNLTTELAKKDLKILSQTKEIKALTLQNISDNEACLITPVIPPYDGQESPPVVEAEKPTVDRSQLIRSINQ